MLKRSILVALMALGLSGATALSVRAADEKGEAPEKKEDAKDVKLTLDQLPVAVRATVQKEVGKGTIGDIDSDTEDGKAVYEVKAVIDGKKWEITVAEDGKLISKKLDDEKDDQPEHKD